MEDFFGVDSDGDQVECRSHDGCITIMVGSDRDDDGGCVRLDDVQTEDLIKWLILANDGGE